ncbi:AI-2E family transporter [Jatrophihabitans sp. YIM 134969]
MNEPARPDRTQLIGQGIARAATWSARGVLIALGLVVLGLVVKYAWVVLLPVLLAVILATVLAPPAAFLRRHGWPPALASGVVVVVGLAVLLGALAVVTPSVVDQAVQFGSSAAGGLQKIEDWLTGPPLNLDESQISTAVDAITQRIQDNASTIASGVLSGVSAVTSVLVTLLLVLVLVFFFVKDGRRFLPWLDRSLGDRVGSHLDVLLTRCWKSVGGFIRVQALVSLVDAVCIGLGVFIVGVPLALPIAVLTFLGGFIPIVGAVVVGSLAILIALVSGGLVKALIVLAIVLAVQQLEGNVLQPVLQSRSLKLHPAVILLAVTGGGSVFGIIGAFLAVPVVAVVAEVVRYLGELLDARSAGPPAVDGEVPDDDSGPDPEPTPTTG